MAERIITIEVDSEGNVSSEAAGFKGVGCVKALKALTDGLGGKVTSETFKPEYYEAGGGAKGTVSAS